MTLGVIAMLAPDEDRAAIAAARVTADLRKLCASRKITYPPAKVFLRAFKTERTLEVWVSNASKMVLLKQYPVLGLSGVLGPKRVEGDKQVPEGWYTVDRFNPKSRFHLSLGLDYPNRADRMFANPVRPGYDIFIHGNQVSIGCLAMGDPMIEEIYTLARAAKAKIRVLILPFHPTNSQRSELRKSHPENVDLWAQLDKINAQFGKTRRVPVVIIDQHGAYRIKG